MKGFYLLRFLLLAMIWGSSFLFIEVALRGLAPMQVVLGRLVAGAAVLQGLLVLRRRRYPRDPRIWAHLLVLAIAANILPFFLFAWGQQRITSGLAGVLNGSTPLFTLAIALAALPEERLTRARGSGLLLGFLGVVLVVGPWDQNPLTSSVPGQLACLGAAMSYAFSFVYTRRLLAGSGYRPLVLAAAQIGLAALIMIAVFPWLAFEPVTMSPTVLGAVLLLGGVGTGLAYPLFYSLIEEAGATSASLVTYVIPIVAVVLGVVVLEEPIGWNLFVGAVVVILGVSIAEGRIGGGVRRARLRPGPTVDAPTP